MTGEGSLVRGAMLLAVEGGELLDSAHGLERS